MPFQPSAADLNNINDRAASITAAVVRRLARGERITALHNVVQALSARMAGQRISKRFAAELQGILACHGVFKSAVASDAVVCSYSKDDYGYRIAVWGAGINFGDRIEFVIGRVGMLGNGTIDMDVIATLNPWMPAQADRNAKMRSVLDGRMPKVWALREAEIAQRQAELAAELADMDCGGILSNVLAAG